MSNSYGTLRTRWMVCSWCSASLSLLGNHHGPPPTSTLETERVRSFSRVGLLGNHHHPPSSKTSNRARFRGWFFLATLVHLHPRIRAQALVFEGVFLATTTHPSSTSTLEYEQTRSFSRVGLLGNHTFENEQTRSFLRVAIASNHHHPPLPSKTSERARFRGWFYISR